MRLAGYPLTSYTRKAPLPAATPPARQGNKPR
jgi:hypothetical protein